LIVEVGPSRRLENLALARDADEIDASGCVVLPGFVDSHVHVVREATQELSPRALDTLAVRVVDEAVRCGTTAIEAKSGLGLTEAGELKTLRVHAELRELPLTLVSTFVVGGLPAELAERLLPMVRRRKLAEFAEIRWEEGTYTPAQVCRLLSLARDLGMGRKVSAGPRSHPDAIGVAVELGATSVNDVVKVTEHDMMLLAQSQTIATLSPAVSFHPEAESCAPARTLIDQGAALALASGWSGELEPAESALSPNMQMTVALACRAMDLTPAEAIAGATINAAHAMGRAHSVGSIEAGKSADLAILGVPDYRELPYHLGVNLVMIRGAVRVERSEVKWPVR
jgi:imidazolonepropionase